MYLWILAFVATCTSSGLVTVGPAPMLPCIGRGRSRSRIRQGQLRSVRCGLTPVSFGPAGSECLRGGCYCTAGNPRFLHVGTNASNILVESSPVALCPVSSCPWPRSGGVCAGLSGGRSTPDLPGPQPLRRRVPLASIPDDGKEKHHRS